MKKKSNRTFIVLSLTLVFMLVIGLATISIFLFRGNASDITRTSLAPVMNPSLEKILEQTQVAGTAFANTLTATSGGCVLIDIGCEGEPTLSAGQQVGILMASAEGTEFADLAQTATAIARATTPAPYDPTLYAARQGTLVYFTTAAGFPTYVQFYATETAIVSEYQGTTQPTPTIVPTRGASYPACAFNWARRDLPEIAVLAQIAIHMYWIDLDEATVRVEAYGEECGNSDGVQSFGAMTTDFYVTIPVDNLDDDEAIVDQIQAIYWALKTGLEIWWLPAPFGYLDITFTHSGETRVLRAMFPEIERAVEQNLEGTAFIEAVY